MDLHFYNAFQSIDCLSESPILAHIHTLMADAAMPWAVWVSVSCWRTLAAKGSYYEFCYVLTEKPWEAEMTNCAFKPRSTYYFYHLFLNQPLTVFITRCEQIFQLPSCDLCMELIVTAHPTSKPFLNYVNWTNSIQHWTPWDVNECSGKKKVDLEVNCNIC